MYRSTIQQIPSNRCAFHQNNLITNFCKYHECLLPLCKLCLPIHRRQHGNKKGPMDICNIDDEIWSVQNKIGGQIKKVQEVYFQIVVILVLQINKMNKTNELHTQMKKIIISERQKVMHAINLYYDSLCIEIDNNCKRKQIWMQQINEHYNNTRNQLMEIHQKLQNEQNLRTIIMWNRLHPEYIVNDIIKQAKKEFAPPSMIPCDVQQLISAMSKNQKMTVLDLHGDMGFNSLEKVLYTLRYGEEESVLSNKPTGISIISRESRVSNKLIGSKSTDKI